MSAHQALEKLLLSLFSADELRRWLRFLPDGERLVGGLPGPTASPAQLASDAVDLLERDGQLADAALWDRLIGERPRRKGDIDGVRALFKTAAAEAAPKPTAAPTGSAAPTDVITVLMVSASPDTGARLRVDREFRDIINRIRGARHRDRFKFVQVQAASFADLRTALMEHEPQVLHLSSHGLEDGSLAFETIAGEPQVVSKKSLLRLFAALKDRLRMIVLNACFSEAVASDIPTIEAAIGMSDAVADTAAIDFGVAFYESLGFGKPVATAFQVALAGLDDSQADIPKLYGKPDLKLLDP
jgi:hypothetical protein